MDEPEFATDVRGAQDVVAWLFWWRWEELIGLSFEAAKAASKPARNLEDKIYEIEDELRLAMEPVA